MIFICNFHVLSNLLLIYICKLHWNLSDAADIRHQVWACIHRLSPRTCLNFTRTLPRTCLNFTRTLPRTCLNFTRTLPRTCLNFTRTLPRTFVRSAERLSPCARVSSFDSAKVLTIASCGKNVLMKYKGVGICEKRNGVAVGRVGVIGWVQVLIMAIYDPFYPLN